LEAVVMKALLLMSLWTLLCCRPLPLELRWVSLLLTLLQFSPLA